MKLRYGMVLAIVLTSISSAWAELPTKKVLTLGVAKRLVAAAEAEAKKRGATVVSHGGR